MLEKTALLFITLGMLLMAFFNLKSIIAAHVSMTEFIYGKDSWLTKWQKQHYLSDGYLLLCKLFVVGMMVCALIFIIGFG